ncbi:MAG: TonB family protein [Bdellovibrionaceae bacterium]|nr:TonB family protein [Bdellovibrio sp.]
MTYFIILSVIIHLTLRSGIFTLANLVEVRKRNPLTEIVLVEKEVEPKNNESREKPIIKQLDPVDQVDNDNSLARFDSEKTRRVREETRAREIGLTRNASFKSKNGKAMPAKPPEESSEVPEFARMSNSNPRQQNPQAAAISTTLPGDIRFSDATNLNTDANIYYSFYSRVEELFYVRWSERLHYYWDRIDFSFKKNQLSGRTWSTVLEIWLSASGEYHSAHILKASGYKPFDEAAVFAFKDARFFPNPPRAKVEPDGFIRLRYRLSVPVAPFQ